MAIASTGWTAKRASRSIESARLSDRATTRLRLFQSQSDQPGSIPSSALKVCLCLSLDNGGRGSSCAGYLHPPRSARARGRLGRRPRSPRLRPPSMHRPRFRPSRGGLASISAAISAPAWPARRATSAPLACLSPRRIPICGGRPAALRSATTGKPAPRCRRRPDGALGARLEYLFVDLGTPTNTLAVAGLPMLVDSTRLQMNVTRAGVNYRF